MSGYVSKWLGKDPGWFGRWLGVVAAVVTGLRRITYEIFRRRH